MEERGKDAKLKIWNQLKEVALRDGVISEEEKNLLADIIVDIEVYSQKLHKALEDGIISENEKLDLFEGRMQIVESAYKSARDDLIISDDEKELLKSICRVILNLEDQDK